jgi:hypothetical protein
MKEKLFLITKIIYYLLKIRDPKDITGRLQRIVLTKLFNIESLHKFKVFQNVGKDALEIKWKNKFVKELTVEPRKV